MGWLYLLLYILFSLIIGFVAYKQELKHIGEEAYDMSTGEHWIIDNDFAIERGVLMSFLWPGVAPLMLAVLLAKGLEKLYTKISKII